MSVADKFIAFRETSESTAATDIWYSCLTILHRTPAPELAPSAQLLRPAIMDARNGVMHVHDRLASAGMPRRGHVRASPRMGRGGRNDRAEYLDAVEDAMNDAARDACVALVNTFCP